MPANTLKLLRKVHLYFGLFISPALLFFAFTGALQTAGLHETIAGSNYKPAKWIVTLAQIHKKQTATLPQRKPPAAPAATAAQPVAPVAKTSAPTDSAPKPKSHSPMKAFFLIVCIGLFTSTLTGIYMGYKYNNSKTVVTVLLLAGILLPLALLPF